jgi:hypothetical protein
LSTENRTVPQGTEGRMFTDKKGEKKFLVFKEIEKGAVAKSYMTNSLLIYD